MRSEMILGAAVMILAVSLVLVMPVTAQRAEGREPGAIFRDCDNCPEMVVIPPGSFAMGSENARNYERPIHQVQIDRAFAASRFPVTVSQFRAYADASPGRVARSTCYTRNEEGGLTSNTAANWRNPGFEQTDTHPVVCVGWAEIEHYLRWLSSQAGRTYRLLSEAEWEYVARAGQSEAELRRVGQPGSGNLGRPATAEEDCCFGHANGPDRWIFTSPVDAFPANPFGLHDMTGNITTLLADCVNEDYEGAPGDGSAWVSRERVVTSWAENGWTSEGICFGNIQRGRNWAAPPRPDTWHVRRGWWYPWAAGDFQGFRVAVTLEPPSR